MYIHIQLSGERGFFTTKGSPVSNAPLIAKLLEAISQPTQVAILHYKGHETTHNTVSLGNNTADQVAGQIALQQGPLPILFLRTSLTLNYSKAKIEALLSQENTSKHSSGWITLHDKLVLPEKQAMSIITQIHDSLTTVACDGLRRGPLSPNPPICGKPGIFFLCNQTTLLQCFPPNWTQPCTPVFLMPYLTILTPQAMEDQIQPTCHRRRALAAAPLLLRGGLFMALGLRVGGLGSAMQFYYKLSTDLN